MRSNLHSELNTARTSPNFQTQTSDAVSNIILPRPCELATMKQADSRWNSFLHTIIKHIYLYIVHALWKPRKRVSATSSSNRRTTKRERDIYIYI